ncbi:sucrase ferredoxin [Oculatella sp. LEGE 06141]|uniref:sucrase ferredoxin n=1 Tax=Oculatella sp. LEGE 06141 TaxID=1828648 RepID=UPI001881813B|nr:sucrase ferredoxin [Oculatella sp. LEGE 06141]MBE9178544.1 sucrase ferredoxin [Oculatella sp. LEGE 06141]
MNASSLTADCQLCSVISKTNGEDPIGSANPCDGWLVMELPLPWTNERFHHDPLLQPIHSLFHDLHDQGIRVAPMAIAPDQEYSIPNRANVFYYYRPDRAFAQYEKQAFLLPADQIIFLIKALLFQPDDLHRFSAYQQPTDDIRDIMVCTHGNIDIACARFGHPIYAQLRKKYGAQSNGKLRVWRCSHFGGHQFAPTLVDFPTGQVWGHLEPHILEGLINRNGPVTDLRPFYRGWSGLGQYEQMVEREIWMQRGWEWLPYRKSGQVLAQDPTHEEWNADWAEVRLEFASPDGCIAGTYEARVEICGSVMTARNSGEAQTPVKQYRVNRLRMLGANS